MHEVKEKVKKICEMREKFTCALECELDKGIEHLDTNEAGEAADIIKDLAEAEEKLWKACYYKKVIEAMDEGEEMPEMPFWMPKERYGYDHYRYSNGHFAPKGHGHHMSGYIPEMPPYMDRLGYLEHKNAPEVDRSISQTHQNEHPYDKWDMARRHYHESGRPEDKKMMDKHAQEHMMETVETIKNIWDEADPTMKSRIRNDLDELMRNMK